MNRRRLLAAAAACCAGAVAPHGWAQALYAAPQRLTRPDLATDEGGQYAESLVLMSRLLARKDAGSLVHFHRGEVYRLRGGDGDQDLALSDYRASIEFPKPPPAAFRGIGLIARQRGQNAEAIQAFARYIELAPDAPDSAFIKNYMSELDL